MVTSTADSGPGSFREVLELAEPYDRIVFDPTVFPPDAPAVIMVGTALPVVSQGYVTIDASNAGVVLDGSLMDRDTWEPGLDIHSANNRVMGLTVQNFTGTGIVVTTPNGIGNVIGGDPSVGAGPIGQANLLGGNAFGIGVWDHATANTITGNLIGVRPDGTPFPNHSGMWITDHAVDNTVGPGNIIAHNEDCGIRIDGPATSGITVTANSVYDNTGRGVCYFFTKEVDAPTVDQVAIATGSVSGWACGGCRVEVFSDDDSEARHFEGSATADSDGRFSFSKGAPFAAGQVTLTTITPAGDTSEISPPVSADLRLITIQLNNVSRRSAVTPRTSDQLTTPDTGISISGSGMWGDLPGNFDGPLHTAVHLGAGWIHSALYEIEDPIDWSLDEWEVPPEFLDFFDRLNQQNVSVNYLLHYWNKEGYRNGELLPNPRFRDEDDIDRYIEYVRYLVRLFKGRVAVYTIWSEPENCGGEMVKCVTIPDYIDLLRRVVPVIREEDPLARIANAPNILPDNLGFLRAVVESDVVDDLDVIQWHGQYHVTPDDPFYMSRYDNYYYTYPDIIQEIQSVAEANGFNGVYWSTEGGWDSLEHAGADGWWQMTLTARRSAKYWIRGMIQNFAIRVAPSTGGVPGATWIESSTRRVATIMAGASPRMVEARVAGIPVGTRHRVYEFDSADGSRMVALWTEEPVVENDPGTQASVMIPGAVPQRVVGIDVLYGFEQELEFQVTADGVVIRNLLIKDYPLIIRLER